MKRKKNKIFWPSGAGIWTPDFWTNSLPKFEFWGRLDLSSPGFLELLDFNKDTNLKFRFFLQETRPHLKRKRPQPKTRSRNDFRSAASTFWKGRKKRTRKRPTIRKMKPRKISQKKKQRKRYVCLFWFSIRFQKEKQIIDLRPLFKGY